MVTAVCFHVLFNFSTGADSYYTSLLNALRAIDDVGPLDQWEVREVVGGKVVRVILEGRGKGPG